VDQALLHHHPSFARQTCCSKMWCLGVVLLAQAAAQDKFLGSRLSAELVAAKHKEKLRSSLQAKLDEFAERYNISFQLGYRDHDVSLALAAGCGRPSNWSGTNPVHAHPSRVSYENLDSCCSATAGRTRESALGRSSAQIC